MACILKGFYLGFEYSCLQWQQLWVPSLAPLHSCHKSWLYLFCSWQLASFSSSQFRWVKWLVIQKCYTGLCNSLWWFFAYPYWLNLEDVCWQGPVNFVSLRSVSPNLQALAMAMSTVCIHVLGDVPSAPIVGAIQVPLFFTWTLSKTCL